MDLHKSFAGEGKGDAVVGGEFGEDEELDLAGEVGENGGLLGGQEGDLGELVDECDG